MFLLHLLVPVSAASSSIASSYTESAGFDLALYQKVGVLDGSSALNPWCHELPDPVTKVTYDNYVSISRHDAETNGWEQGDIVKVSGNGAEIDRSTIVDSTRSSQRSYWYRIGLWT